MEKINCERYSTRIVKEQVERFKTVEKLNYKQLRSCKAYTFDVYEGDTIRYRVLVSYNTIVAYFDYDGGVFLDVLRVVYGYTAISAQHIAKFKKELLPLINRDLRYM